LLVGEGAGEGVDGLPLRPRLVEDEAINVRVAAKVVERAFGVNAGDHVKGAGLILVDGRLEKNYRVGPNGTVVVGRVRTVFATCIYITLPESLPNFSVVALEVRKEDWLLPCRRQFSEQYFFSYSE